jgi:hypothetical protein
MAFDLVQYFVEQIDTQQPLLLNQYAKAERRALISELNALSLGKLISQWRTQSKEIYQEILDQDELFIQEIARHITTSPFNESILSKSEQEIAITRVAKFQLQELKQLNDTANLNLQGLNELLIGQIEHLAGHAEDWVWLTNNLTELKGSKPIIEDTVSLEASLKEFNQMASQHHDTHEEIQLNTTVVPTWAKIAEPVVAIVILWILASALCKVFA